MSTNYVHRPLFLDVHEAHVFYKSEVISNIQSSDEMNQSDIELQFFKRKY